MFFKSSVQRELDRFFKEISKSDFNIREVTKGAFTQARSKLNPWAFQRLNEVAVNTFYQEAEYYVWNQKRLLGVDGSTLGLPNHPTIAEEFGVHKWGSGKKPGSLAMISTLYDCLNQITIDAQIDKFAASEVDLLTRHLEKVWEGDVLLMDRGYPCYWLLFLLQAKKIDFIVRLRNTWWLDVRKFNESEDKETIITFKLPRKDQHRLAEHPEMYDQTLTCRLVKVELENGETQILCTSLIDPEKYLLSDFKEVYHCRWSHEEAYKLLKARVEVEHFSGKTARAIKQDFHAKIFLMTLCAAYAHPIEEKVAKEYKADLERKHNQQINRTNALSVTRDILVAVFLKKMSKKAMEAFDKIVHKTREIIRPGRKCPRVHQKRKYSINYKNL